MPPRLFPQIWIWDDVDRLLQERPVVAKPDRVVDVANGIQVSVFAGRGFSEQ